MLKPERITMICIIEPMVNMAGLLACGVPEVAALADECRCRWASQYHPGVTFET